MCTELKQMFFFFLKGNMNAESSYIPFFINIVRKTDDVLFQVHFSSKIDALVSFIKLKKSFVQFEKLEVIAKNL